MLFLISFSGQPVNYNETLAVADEILIAEEESEVTPEGLSFLTQQQLLLGAGGDDDVEDVKTVTKAVPNSDIHSLVSSSSARYSLLIHQYELRLLNSLNPLPLYILYTQFKNALV